MANEVFAVLLQYLLPYFFQNLLWYFFSNFFLSLNFFASNCCVWLSKCLQYFVQYFCCNFYRILCSISFALSLLPSSPSSSLLSLIYLFLFAIFIFTKRSNCGRFCFCCCCSTLHGPRLPSWEPPPPPCLRAML